MNRIILEEFEFLDDSLYCLDSRKSNHIIKILKSKPGDSLRAGLLGKSTGIAVINSIDLKNRRVIVKYQAENTNLLQANLASVRVFSSLQRPQTVKKIIHLSANCGVSEIFFFPAEKSENSYLNASIWSERNLLDEIILGLEQGGRIFPPKITVLRNKYRIQDHLTLGNRFILEFNHKSILNYSETLDYKNPIQIVFGPESGFLEEDILFFSNLGFQKISISENILRSEIAFAFILAQIELLKCSAS
jgi:16S rRNA (uracil1498-N3)-methyltransferase